MKAILDKQVVAESEATIQVEGDHYFPPDSVREEFLVMSSTITTCPRKGDATYYDVIVEETVRKDAAWSYHEPKEKAAQIKDYIAFWRGVRIIP